jgi:hypothetical protein
MDNEAPPEPTDDLYAEQPHHAQAAVWTSPAAKVLLCVLLGNFGIFIAIVLVRAGQPEKFSGWLGIALFVGAFVDGVRATLLERWGQRGAFTRWAFVLLLLLFAMLGAIALVS